MRIHLNEHLRFMVRHVIPPAVVGGVSSFFAITFIPLTFEQFTLIYWIPLLFAYPLIYKVDRWTEYVIKNYGLHFEKNPFMREMYAKKEFKDYYITLAAVYAYFMSLYILIACGFVPFLKILLVGPSTFISIVLYDFVNDFLNIKKLKRQHIRIES